MPSGVCDNDLLPPNPVEHYFDDNFISDVRDGVLEQLSVVDDCEDLYDAIDLERLKNDDWFIRRFLAWRPTELVEAVKAVHNALLWRKKISINNWYVLEIVTRDGVKKLLGAFG